MTSSLRPEASDTDKAIFTGLLNKVSEADSYFCCGGTMELHNRPLSLFYKSKEDSDSQSANCLDFLLTRNPEKFKPAVDNLFESCNPSQLAKNNKTVYDDSYRFARELPSEDFSLNLDILGEVRSTISELVSGRCYYLPREKEAAVPGQPQTADDDSVMEDDSSTGVDSSGSSTEGESSSSTDSEDEDNSEKESEGDSLIMELEPRLHRLNAYSKDGFFKAHRDTPKGRKHVGTLLFALPVPFEGGVLRVARAGKEVMFDWGSKCSEGVQFSGENDYKVSIPWAFFFFDMEHEVLPVLSGTRVTIAYDVFALRKTTTPWPPSKTKIDTNIRTFPLSDDINAALQNPDFLPEGAKVAIALSHTYPLPKYDIAAKKVASYLKGSDAMLYRDLKSLGLDVTLEAVHEISADSSSDYKRLRQHIPRDEYGPTTVRVGYEYYGNVSHVYYTSKTIVYINEPYERREDSPSDFDSDDRTARRMKAKFAGHLMWIKKPTEFTQIGSYVAYGNEYCISYCYAALVFVVIIPPYGEGPRKYS